jgi:hypothetical protein
MSVAAVVSVDLTQVEGSLVKEVNSVQMLIVLINVRENYTNTLCPETIIVDLNMLTELHLVSI